MPATNVKSTPLDAQRAYVQRIQASGFDYGLAVADAFIRGMRDIGYRSTASALDELIDNAIQAGARTIRVITASDRTMRIVERIAVLDDGHGMDPEMLRLAVVWGGGHRENDRSGFGKYGYGLPSASISAGRRFSVYSAVSGVHLHIVTLDIDDISAGRYTDHQTGKITVPPACPATLPDWLMAHHGTRRKRLHHGTVVILDKLDRVSPKLPGALRANLLKHFGIVYRNVLDRVYIEVDGYRAAPIDPLFITEGAEYYDEDKDRSTQWEARTISVRDPINGRPCGMIRVRASSMPPTFASIDKRKVATRGNQNHRFAIMKEHNGLIILRNGRQIDVLTRGLETTFMNNDRYWKIEIDFDATLDEFFSVTTSKQQIVLSEAMHSILKDEGLYTIIHDLRERYRIEHAAYQADTWGVHTARPRPSELAMADTAQARGRSLPGTQIPERDKAASTDEVAGQTVAFHAPMDDSQELPLREITIRPYRILAGPLPGAPFFRVERNGHQLTLYLNSLHRFYTDIYAAVDATPRLRSSLEVLLFILGEREFNTSTDDTSCYRQERRAWSERLEEALTHLSNFENAPDLPDLLVSTAPKI